MKISDRATPLFYQPLPVYGKNLPPPPSSLVWESFENSIPPSFIKGEGVQLCIILYFLMLMNTLLFHLSNWWGLGPIWVFCLSFVYTWLLLWAFPQSSHADLIFLIAWNLPCYLHFAFCFFYCWFNSNVPSSISSLNCLTGSYNTERLEGGNLEPWITRGI